MSDSVVDVYTCGLIYCSACAPRTMSKEVLEHAVNAQNPTGIDSKWRVAHIAFNDGSPNPSPCAGNSEKLHYLFSC